MATHLWPRSIKSRMLHTKASALTDSILTATRLKLEYNHLARRSSLRVNGGGQASRQSWNTESSGEGLQGHDGQDATRQSCAAAEHLRLGKASKYLNSALEILVG